MKSVEAYDYYEDKWTYLPDMIKERCNHAAVSTGNKMFVIGGYRSSNCEIFDTYSRKFSSIKSFLNVSYTDGSYFEAICAGNKIIVMHGLFHDRITVGYMYNVDKEMWSSFDCGFCKNLLGSNIVNCYTDEFFSENSKCNRNCLVFTLIKQCISYCKLYSKFLLGILLK